MGERSPCGSSSGSAGGGGGWKFYCSQIGWMQGWLGHQGEEGEKTRYGR